MCRLTYQATGACPYCGLTFRRMQAHESELVTCDDCQHRFVSLVECLTTVARIEGEVARHRNRRTDIERAYA